METSSTSRPFGLLLALAVTATILIGCFSEGGVDVRPVKGFVSYQGKPLPGALVMFRPKSGGEEGVQGRVASGYTDDQGSFQLMTSGAAKSGAMEGEYVVLVKKTVDVDASGKPINYQSGEYAPDQPLQKRGKTISQIPASYNDADSSLLTATVGRQDNNFRFELDEKK